jgi:hypothetical protein
VCGAVPCAICDAGDGDALMAGLRALQDRGQFTTTLAEVRTRADVIVFVGGLPVDVAPLIGQRCGIGNPAGPQRHVVVLGQRASDQATLSTWAGLGRVSVEALPLQGDLFDAGGEVSRLVAAVMMVNKMLGFAQSAAQIGHILFRMDSIEVFCRILVVFLRGLQIGYLPCQGSALPALLQTPVSPQTGKEQEHWSRQYHGPGCLLGQRLREEQLE